MYAKGMTTGDIESHMRELYDIDISDSTISRITDKILPIVKEWQERPLEEVYAVVFMDAIHYHVRSEGRIVKRAVYIALGIDMSGKKDVLGMYVGENESAKFWLSIMNGLKNRGVEDILIACVDGLNGFPQAIEAVYPKTEIQQCIIHQIRNTTNYVSYKDLKKLMAGTAPDLPLQKNDVLYISSIKELEKEGVLFIYGDVAKPGYFPFARNMSVQDLILKAGGLLESASTVRIDVSRRIKDPKSVSSSTVIGKSFTVELKNGLLIGESNTLKLEPYDMVFVRRSPGYQKQANVTVNGEVTFTGNYALTKKNERLSDLIAKAGGLSKSAYAKGARLMRRMTADEIRQKQDAVRFATKGTGKDSVSLSSLEVDQTYSVGIELEKALAKPKSDEDLVLREGDVLFVPKYVSTVTVNGAVMYPNTVLYQKGSGIDYYIGQAGGFGNRALKRRAYVVYMNGTVSRLRRNTANAIEPGCEIIVPSKGERKKMTTAGAVGMSSSIASIASMVASMVSLTK